MEPSAPYGCVYPFEKKESPPWTQPGILFQTILYQAFETEPRQSLVNREMLDKSCRSFDSAQSDLADREKALHVGHSQGPT